MPFELNHGVAAVLGMRHNRPPPRAGDRVPRQRPGPSGSLLHGVRERLRLRAPTPGRRAGALAPRLPRNRT